MGMEKRARDIAQGDRVRFNVWGRRKRGERSPHVLGEGEEIRGAPVLGVWERALSRQGCGGGRVL